MPTALEIPCPSGPVVASTPGVISVSGCPGVRLSHWRKRLISSSGRSYPVRCSSAYRSAEPCPAESTNRSRLNHLGSAGLCRRTWVQSVYAIAAAPIGSPGWPDFAASTMSAARNRRVLMQRASCVEVTFSFANFNYPSCSLLLIMGLGRRWTIDDRPWPVLYCHDFPIYCRWSIGFDFSMVQGLWSMVGFVFSHGPGSIVYGRFSMVYRPSSMVRSAVFYRTVSSAGRRTGFRSRRYFQFG